MKYTVEPISSVENAKGSMFKDEITGSTELIFLKRKKGVVAGKHYHEGKAECKNPEILYVLSGKFELIVRDVNTGDEEKQIVSAPAKLTFWPFVYHELVMLEDVIMVELGHDFDKHNDVVKVD